MINYHLSHTMKILFVGINPSLGTYRRRIPFSNNKMFWYLLNAAGLINEQREDLRNDKKLRKMYDTKFGPMYQLGITNLVDRPADRIAELKAGEEIRGRKRIYSIIKRYKPKIVCFVGKATYEKFIGRSVKTYGWKPTIGSSKIFLMHSPLHGLASVRVAELKKIKQRVEKKQ